MIYINNNAEGIKGFETIITIGSFDGFHKGHKKLIDEMSLRKGEKGLKSLVLSFYPRPISVLKGVDAKYLCARDERVKIAATLGIDVFVEYPFTQALSLVDGESFIREILIEKYNCKHIVIGEDFKFGKDRMWDAEGLLKLSKKLGIKTDIIKNENHNNDKISSSSIRRHVENGSVKEAAKLLGRDYYVSGAVSHEEGRGNLNGFLTINIMPSLEKLLPKKGVYITKTFSPGNEAYNTITNIGGSASFGQTPRRVETFAKGLNRYIYGNEVKVTFIDFLRDESRYSFAEELEQIEKDFIAMENYYNNIK